MEAAILILIIGGAVIVIALCIWLFGKLVLRLLKHAIIAALLGLVLALLWYQPCSRPRRDPNLGKHAYAVNNDQYLGVVVGSAHDPALGEVWIIQPPSGYKTKYRKARVVLKDQ